MRPAFFVSSLLLMSPAALAQTEIAPPAPGPVFKNILMTSPSIVSPSQYYQVPTHRMEGMIAGGDEKSEINLLGTKSERDGSSVDLAVGGLFRFNSQVQLGIEISNEQREFEDDKSYRTSVSPLVTYSPIEMLSLGLQAHLLSGKEESSTVTGQSGSETFNYTVATLGLSAHQDLWEATLAYTTEHEASDDEIGSSAAVLNLHGRYRFAPNLALGVSFQQTDYSDFADDREDEGALGVHIEGQLSEKVALELAYQSYSDYGGVDGMDAYRFSALGSLSLSEGLELGLKGTYLKAEYEPLIEYTRSEIGVFISSDI